MPLRGRFSPAQEDPLRQELKKDATNGAFRTFDVTTLSFVDTYKGVLPWNQKHLWITCLSSSLVKVVSCCLLLLHEI